MLFSEAAIFHCVAFYESRHARFHFPESEGAVEAFLAGRRVQDDVALRDGGQDGVHDRLPDAHPLKLGKHGAIVDGGLVGAVRNGAAETDELAGVVDEYGGVTGFKGFFVYVGGMVAHSDALQDFWDHFPVNAFAVCFDINIHFTSKNLFDLCGLSINTRSTAVQLLLANR